jgi:hypothetical protein
VPVIGAAAVLVAAAILASLMPAARASRVDVISALRADYGLGQIEIAYGSGQLTSGCCRALDSV